MKPGPNPQTMILRGAGAAIAGFVIRFGARFLFLFVAGQFYGATLFGAFVVAAAVVELAVSVAGMGMKKLLFQFLDQRGGQPPSHVVADAALLVFLASLMIAASVMLAVSIMPGSVLAENTAHALLLLAPMIGGQALLDLMLAATRWTHRMRYDVISRSVIEPYAGVAAAVLAHYAGLEGSGLILGYGFGTLAALVYAAFGAQRRLASAADPALAASVLWRPSGTRLLSMVRAARANIATDGLSALFARLDLYLVGALLGEGPAGIYGMARQACLPVRQARQSFDGLLTPLVARTLQNHGPAQTAEAIATATRLILVIQLPILIVFAAAGRQILGLFGAEFAAGYMALVLLAGAEMVQGAFGVSELVFVYRRPSLALIITGVSTLFSLAAGVILTLIGGIAGAAASVLLSYLLRAVWRRRALWREFGVSISIARHAGPAAAGAAGFVAALVLPLAMTLNGPTAFAAPLMAGLLIYAGGIVAWLIVSRDSIALNHFSVD